MKKTKIFVIALLVCLFGAMTISLSSCVASCETVVLGSSLTVVMPASGVWENPQYLIWQGRYGDVLVDKETGLVYPLQVEKDERVPEGVSVRYAYTHDYVFEETRISWYTYMAVPKYDPDTGSVSHYIYYPTTVIFDYTGKEIDRQDRGDALTEDEVKNLIPVEDDTYFSYAKEVGSGRSKYEGEETPTYTALQQKVLDYAYALENEYRGEYHLTFGQGFEREGRVYFSITRSNQKEWAGQSATKEGIYHTAVLCYDAATHTFETLFESSEGKEILLFDDKNVLIRKGNTIDTYGYETGKREKVYTLSEGDSYTFEYAKGILHITRPVTIKGTPAGDDKYASFSFPCDLHTFITVSGTILARDYDLSAEEKEMVTEGKEIEYQEW